MKLTRLEQETIIIFNEAEEMASVYTAAKRASDHMLKEGFEPVKCMRDAWWFEIPKQAVRIKRPGKRAVYIGGVRVPKKLRTVKVSDSTEDELSG